VVRRVFLHVGLPKSGTSYLQAVLARNRDLLQERAGLLYPGETWVDQVDAVRDLRGLAVPPARRSQARGAWDRLVAEIRQWPGDVVVSMEWLSASTPEEIRRIGADLAGSELHVLFTVRDLARTVPAAWQEGAQNGATWRWPEFLEQVTSEDAAATKAGSAFWRQQDVVEILDRWLQLAPPERTHVVTVPPTGSAPDELWRRLAGVIGIRAADYDLASARSNASLGLESAEVMRRVNEQARDRKVGRHDYERAFKHHLAKHVLASRKSAESKVRLPLEYAQWAAERAERQIEAIKVSGVDVVGSLEELRPDPDRPGEPLAEPDSAAVLGAAVDALTSVALARQQERDEQAAEMRRLDAQLARLRDANAELRAEIRLRSSRPVRQALIDLSAQRPMLHRARTGYWKLVNAGRRLRPS
jgi:hypothetical protein